MEEAQELSELLKAIVLPLEKEVADLTAKLQKATRRRSAELSTGDPMTGVGTASPPGSAGQMGNLLSELYKEQALNVCTPDIFLLFRYSSLYLYLRTPIVSLRFIPILSLRFICYAFLNMSACV